MFRPSRHISIFASTVVAACLAACVHALGSPNYDVKSLVHFSMAGGDSTAATVALRPFPRGTDAPIRCMTCGVSRWAIKTLSDNESSDVNYAPKDSTVRDLAAIAAPHLESGAAITGYSKRIAPVELQTFKVSARLVGWRVQADQDLQLAVEDPTDDQSTMIAEAPSPDCSGACNSSHHSQFVQVRQDLAACLGQTSSSVLRPSNPLQVELIGVGFFDYPHGQYGVAPNGIELHPILSVRTISGTCPNQTGGAVEVVPR